MLVRFLTLISLFAFLVPAALAQQNSANYALLIGVTNYHHAGKEPLQFPEADARAIGELLIKAGYPVEILFGKQVTSEACFCSNDTTIPEKITPR